MRPGQLLGLDIEQLLHEDPNQMRVLVQKIRSEDLADILAELDPDEAAKLLERLPADEAAEIFARLGARKQELLAAQLPPDSVVQIASEMADDERADFINAMPNEMGGHILETLEKVDPEAAEEVREIEKWPDTSAGHLMTTSYVKVTPEMTVAAALGTVRMRARENGEFVYTTYALDSANRLIGVTSVRDLIVAEPNRRVADIITTNIIDVAATADQEEVARKMAKYDLNAIPVVDENGTLLGVITIDDVVDVLVQEQTEDVQKIGGVEPLDVSYFQTSFLQFIRKRGVWLLILFVEEFFTQTALRYYAPVFDAIRGASYYVPLLLSTGGNSGSQSSTLIIRGMAVGELKLKDWLRIFVREALMGFVLGCMLGTIGFVRVLMYRDQHANFALTIGLTLIGIVMTGCTVGSMLPLVLKRLGVDPATSSTPFIASLVDVLGIIVFVHVAKIVMAEVIAAGGMHP